MVRKKNRAVDERLLPGVEVATSYVIRKELHAHECKCYYNGYDWDQLSEEEAAVFGLELADMPGPTAIYGIYASAIGMLANETLTEPEIDRLRLDLPWLAYQKPSAGEFQRFASLFEVSSRKAHAFFRKQELSLIRAGVMVYPDDEEFAFQESIDVARSRSYPCFWPGEGA